MIVYLSLLAGAVILGIPMCRKKMTKIAYCIIMGMALFIVAALRRSVGHDYNNYGWMYLGYASYDTEEIVSTRVEKGYAMINKLFADYVEEYQIIFIICAAVFAIGVVLIAYKYCKTPWIGFACFLTFGVYFNTLNFLRQMIAAFIMMYAIRYIKKNQFFRYLLLVLFATCFHVSALVMIPFYFILRIKMTPTVLGIYTGILALSLIFSWDIIGFVTRFFYKSYVVTNIHVTTGCSPTCTIFFGLLLAAAFAFRKRLTESDPFNTVFINCIFWSFFFEALGIKHSILSRLSVLFLVPAAIVLAPRVLEAIIDKCKEFAKSDSKKKTILTVTAVSVFAVYNLTMYGVFIATNYNGVMPYRTMFEDFGTEASQQ